MATLSTSNPDAANVTISIDDVTYQFEGGNLEVADEATAELIRKRSRTMFPQFGIQVVPSAEPEAPREPDDSPGNPDPQQDPATGSEVTPEATQEAQDEADTTSDGELATPANPGGDFPARTEDATGGELPAHDDNRLVEGDILPPDTVVTPGPEPENVAGKPLDRMNREELVEAARVRGVDPTGLTKAQIREALSAPLDKSIA